MTSSLRVGFCVLDFPQSPKIFSHERNLHKNSHLALVKIVFFFIVQKLKFENCSALCSYHFCVSCSNERKSERIELKYKTQNSNLGKTNVCMTGSSLVLL